ncbi:hypothetical protein At1D1609_52660 (plasmid) [Agrobacterium tumefaciens]|uniref:Uncharacterized protein n=1 Tax=Agrobacterium tumefaciens TaxID=358 RepID=A0A2L2LLV0_AGRTU|nr:hypothetical protein At1D1609_52660 [Agrobacterium tumefaciens]
MENRARLILKVTATVVQEIGGERTGVPDFASFAPPSLQQDIYRQQWL